MDITLMFMFFMIFGMPFVAILGGMLVYKHYQFKEKELEIRRLEASAKLIAAGSETPEWLENDPAAMAEWKKAREEIDKASVKAGVHRQKVL